MRNKIFQDAILLQDKLEETGSGQNKEHFEFKFKNEDKNILVTLEIEDNRTTINCTCLHSTLNGDALCSYQLAVLFLKFKQSLRKLKKRW